jgi:hypothetical protein
MSSNTITISGRFDSLSDAVRDAREQFEDGVSGHPSWPDVARAHPRRVNFPIGSVFCSPWYDVLPA